MRRFAMSLLMLSIAWSVSARAGECPVESGGLDAIEAALRKASSCDHALQLFQACAFGSSGDVRLGQAVRDKCEAGFLRGLDSATKAAYDKEQRLCAHKYAKKSGTMYRSFEAFCGAKAARHYFHEYSRRP